MNLIQRPVDHLDGETLNLVAFTDIFVIFKGHAAFHTCLNLFNLIFEALKGFKHALMNDHIFTKQTHAAGAFNLAFCDLTCLLYTSPSPRD